MEIKAIHQFHPSCNQGDGITNGMLFTRKLLRMLGFESEIYCENIPSALRDEIRPWQQRPDRPDQLWFVHHSLGYENSAWLQQVSAQKVLVYHNITPPELLPADGPFRRLSELGRQQLQRWAPDYLGAIGDSGYNSAELRDAGYRNIVTLPLLVDSERIRNASCDRTVLAPLRDRINLLFVGRICDNKRQIKLLDVLREFLHFTDQPVRLILAGGITSEAYRRHIEARISELGLTDHVLLTGMVPDATLMALYRTADAFVCMSEHEGFGMPLIEAMLFDVPVIAHATSSIPDTLGEGGLLLKDDVPRQTAALLHLLMSEPALRRRVIAGQRRNLRRFARSPLLQQLANYLTELGIPVPQPPAPHEPTEVRAYWQVEGPFDSSYSLAIVNRELARALSRRGQDVGLRSMEGQGDYPPSAGFLASDPETGGLSQRARSSVEPPDIALRFCYPPHVDDMRGTVRTVHTYGWEETGFPTEYVQAFNRKLDLITVLSRFVEKILRDNGVRIPIAVTGAGVDQLLQVQPQTPKADLRSFNFLHISSCFPRKGVDALLAAYGKAFRRSDDVALVIKTFPNPHNHVAQQLREWQRNDQDYPHVVLIERDASTAEIAGLYRACDAFVAPSRGEGLGLPMAEAMLFGLPVITTGWGGQRDFCDDQTAWLCDYRFARAQTHINIEHSVWAEPDVNHLTALLKEVRMLTPDQRAARTTPARERVLREYTWERSAQRTEQAVAALKRQPLLRNEPRIGWLSSWNTRCGIATYSSFLTSTITRDRLTFLANRATGLVAPDDANVIRCWNQSQNETLNDTLDSIVANKIDTIVIQYNFGFFTLETLARFIERLKQANIGIHCFFHATAEFMQNGRRISLGDIAGALAKADRLYVHGLDDMNRLKGY
ncbi:MAG: glycosyltransferase, partial [Burkholderiaceae bacterium]|nr:glycosyltransferase [Burkholderiaceae bacterium]